MRSVNCMIKAVISIVILALTFAGVPAQAFVQSNDHDCCESEQYNIMAEPVSVITSQSLQISQTDSSIGSSKTYYALHHAPVVDNSSSLSAANQYEQDLSCDGCDSDQGCLSCFSVDGVSFALFSLSKIDLGYPKSDLGLSTEFQFITLQVSPEIRPPKV